MDGVFLKNENLEKRSLQKPLMWQISVDFYTEDPKLLNDVEYVKDALVKAAKEADISIISSNFHQFPVQGLSGFVFLEESHISIHTWPEYSFGVLDIEVCDGEPEKALEFLKKAFKMTKYYVKRIERGLF
ncbi:MAG: adenosylmethionine decarboxylase [Candidatus Micrarchaeota archaeon]|nr:adenosylmethionine decarboxylase [Candidatus Micrarchaeota archaeon]